MTLVGLAAILVQLLRGQTPVEIFAYVLTYSLVLLPTIVFITAASISLHVLLRRKLFVYLVTIAIGTGLLYLYNLGYNHWLYNPVLHGLWTYSDLAGAGNNQTTILIHRIYCLAAAGACLSVAHLFFQRKSSKGFWVDGHLSGTGWSTLLVLLSLTTVIATGWIISSLR